MGRLVRRGVPYSVLIGPGLSLHPPYHPWIRVTLIIVRQPTTGTYYTVSYYSSRKLESKAKDCREPELDTRIGL